MNSYITTEIILKQYKIPKYVRKLINKQNFIYVEESIVTDIINNYRGVTILYGASLEYNKLIWNRINATKNKNVLKKNIKWSFEFVNHQISKNEDITKYLFLLNENAHNNDVLNISNSSLQNNIIIYDYVKKNELSLNINWSTEFIEKLLNNGDMYLLNNLKLLDKIVNIEKMDLQNKNINHNLIIWKYLDKYNPQNITNVLWSTEFIEKRIENGISDMLSKYYSYIKQYIETKGCDFSDKSIKCNNLIFQYMILNNEQYINKCTWSPSYINKLIFEKNNIIMKYPTIIEKHIQSINENNKPLLNDYSELITYILKYYEGLIDLQSSDIKTNKNIWEIIYQNKIYSDKVIFNNNFVESLIKKVNININIFDEYPNILINYVKKKGCMRYCDVDKNMYVWEFMDRYGLSLIKKDVKWNCIFLMKLLGEKIIDVLEHPYIIRQCYSKTGVILVKINVEHKDYDYNYKLLNLITSLNLPCEIVIWSPSFIIKLVENCDDVILKYSEMLNTMGNNDGNLVTKNGINIKILSYLLNNFGYEINNVYEVLMYTTYEGPERNSIKKSMHNCIENVINAFTLKKLYKYTTYVGKIRQCLAYYYGMENTNIRELINNHNILMDIVKHLPFDNIKEKLITKLWTS